MWTEAWVHVSAVSLLPHPELQLLHRESGFGEGDLRLVCEALAGSRAWLRSWTVWLVTSGQVLSFSESPLHLSDGHYINSYSDLKMYCLGQNALL